MSDIAIAAIESGSSVVLFLAAGLAAIKLLAPMVDNWLDVQRRQLEVLERLAGVIEDAMKGS